MSEGRVCRRCLLSDMQEERAAFALIQEWVDALPDDRRAADDVRRARLCVCAQCDHLASGTCALCGCYVEFRAALQNASCPRVPKAW